MEVVTACRAKRRRGVGGAQLARRSAILRLKLRSRSTGRDLHRAEPWSRARAVRVELLETRLQGPLLIAPERFGDERGFFSETYRQSRFAELGIGEEMVQDNHSRSREGVVRGMHFQIGEGVAKLVRCGRGAIYDVVVDLRRGSPTYGEWEGFQPRRAEPPRALLPDRLRPRLLHAQRGRRRALQAEQLLLAGDRARDRVRRSRCRDRLAAAPGAADRLAPRRSRRRGWPRSRTRCRSSTGEPERRWRRASPTGACLACGGPLAHEPTLSSRDLMHGVPGRFEIYSCTRCGSGVTFPPAGPDRDRLLLRRRLRAAHDATGAARAAHGRAPARAQSPLPAGRAGRRAARHAARRGLRTRRSRGLLDPLGLAGGRRGALSGGLRGRACPRRARARRHAGHGHARAGVGGRGGVPPHARARRRPWARPAPRPCARCAPAGASP